MEYTCRAEIIANQSVQDDIVELLEREIENVEYTLIPGVEGKGVHSKKSGDTVWPELNFILTAYTDDEGAKRIKAIIKSVKEKFPNEGITLFFTGAFI